MGRRHICPSVWVAALPGSPQRGRPGAALLPSVAVAWPRGGRGNGAALCSGLGAWPGREAGGPDSTRGFQSARSSTRQLKTKTPLSPVCEPQRLQRADVRWFLLCENLRTGGPIIAAAARQCRPGWGLRDTERSRCGPVLPPPVPRASTQSASWASPLPQHPHLCTRSTS